MLHRKLASKYYNESSNATFYDLTASQKLSINLGDNLGSCPKFYKQGNKVQFKSMQAIIDRLKKDARTKWLINNNTTERSLEGKLRFLQ